LSCNKHESSIPFTRSNYFNTDNLFLFRARKRGMPDLSEKIEVMVAGAVQHGGRVMISRLATIPSALAAAGGLASTKPTLWPAGIIRVRRKQNGLMKAFRKFDMSDGSGDWERLELLDGDVLTFQWHVVMNDDA
jgi:protein involved in polysaccharide export with SLBB domain